MHECVLLDYKNTMCMCVGGGGVQRRGHTGSDWGRQGSMEGG